jgi:predicted phosphodiesterase
MAINSEFKLECIQPPADSPYTREVLVNYLSGNRINPEHGDEFTGRPVTQIVATEIGVIKFRTEYTLPELEARRFVAKAVERERQIGIHHPRKTWFLIYSTDAIGRQIVDIANITPLLTPLHQYKIQEAETSIEHLLPLIVAGINRYIETARLHELCIDLSLSNFGIDESDRVYYIDDDFYRCNQFIDLPEFLANLIRSQDVLDITFFAQLGEQVRSAILDNFGDKHWLTVIAEGLRNLFIPTHREAERNALIKGIYSNDTFTYQPRNTSRIFALLADIHANAPALYTALDYLAKRQLSDVMVLGDIVGYGPHPKQCIDMLQNNAGYSFIRGNHDHAVATGNSVTGSTSLAGWTLLWTMANLDPESKEWLGLLPCYLQSNDWLAVHGSPRDKTFFNGYVYQMNYMENLDVLAQRDIRFCFHGHTHIQKIYYRERGVDYEATSCDNGLGRMSHALICPGSVGQPRGGVAGVELALVNLDTLELEFQRLDYDMQPTIRDMERHRFPRELADRLLKGF